MRTRQTRTAGVFFGIVLLAIALAVPAVALAANKPTDPTPYPWSKVAGGTSGDYFVDEYNGVSTGHILEAANTDRLLDILSTNGTWYIALTGPEHASGQKTLGLLNTEAKAAGISKIYTWDPFLDGHQLNSVDASGWGTLVGRGSVNSSGSANVNEPWRLVKKLLPTSAFQSGGALFGYDGRGTVLLTVKITDRADVEAGKQILASWSLEDTDAATFDPAGAGAKTWLDAYLAPPSNGNVVAPNSVRSQFDFFKRLYNAAATAVETQSNSTPTADRYGAPVTIFSDADYPGGAGFKLREISLQEYFDLVQSPGQKVFFFAGAGCHNTQAIIGSVAEKAKLLGTPVVYVVDLNLSSNVHFLTGANIDHADKATATGGLWVRDSAASRVATGALYPQYGYSYLYAAAASYLDPGLRTEYNSKQWLSDASYPNGDFSASETSGDPWVVGDANPNAKHIQVPFLIRYDKDAAEPVVNRWMHTDSSSTATHTVYDEYMLDLANVRHTALSVAATGFIKDGLTRTQFAEEAISALTPVLEPKTVADANVTIPQHVVWVGTASAPAPTVSFQGRTLVAGSDYSVEYSHNAGVGLATLTVAGRGAYSGTKNVTFSIDPPVTALRTLSAGNGKLRVTWGKVAGTTRYEVSFRAKGVSAWRKVSIRGSKLSLTIAKLKKGKAYQVRIRNYQTVAGANYFSAFSAVKTSKAVK